MKIQFLLLIGVVAVFSYPSREQLEYFEHNEQVIDHVNAVRSTWKAGHNFGKYMTMETIKGLCGALQNENLYLPTIDYKPNELKDLPDNFDSRDKW